MINVKVSLSNFLGKNVFKGRENKVKNALENQENFGKNCDVKIEVFWKIIFGKLEENKIN